MSNNRFCKLTAIQIISSDSISDNFKQISLQLASLPQTGENNLVLLPENALCFANRDIYLNVAEILGEGSVQQQLSQLAQQYNCTLICGSFPIQSQQQDKIYTTSLVYSPQGELIEHYNKIHLFDADVADKQGAYRESETFIAGKNTKVLDLGFAKVGLAICYDLRFPGLFQQLRESGADIILLPAAFTKATGEAHWKALLQARAIETQCYFVAANQGGDHFIGHPNYETRSTYGHSMIINPWGEIVSELTIGSGLIQADFERDRLDDIRKKMQVLQHNRFCSTYKI
jgi:predicted amidohydrolase